MKGVKRAISLLVLLSTVIAETTKKSINIQGDVKIIGLFQIHETENADCGIKVSMSSLMAAEAVKWYLEGLNSYGQLPFKIGKIKNTQTFHIFHLYPRHPDLHHLANCLMSIDHSHKYFLFNQEMSH